MEKFITDEVERSRRGYGREISENILPPASVNAYRRRKGLTPYPIIKRVRGDDQSYGERDAHGEFIHEYEERNGYLTAPRATQLVRDEGGKYYIPSRLVDNGYLEPAANQDVLDLLIAGCSRWEIAAGLNISVSNVRAIISKLRIRENTKNFRANAGILQGPLGGSAQHAVPLGSPPLVVTARAAGIFTRETQ